MIKKPTLNKLTSEIDIDDLNNLENELNNLATETSGGMSNNVFESGFVWNEI